jgi:hypothetical protein
MTAAKTATAIHFTRPARYAASPAGSSWSLILRIL